MDKLAIPLMSPFASDREQLCQKLRSIAEETGETSHWNPGPFRLFREYGVFQWFTPKAYGGVEWNDSQILAGYVELAASCLTSTFVLTQRSAAVSRIVKGNNLNLKQRVLPNLSQGDIHATIGISHLTTSHQHHTKPALQARVDTDGLVVRGFSPWVTAAEHADWLVVAASMELEPEQQVMFAVPRQHAGVFVDPPVNLLALSSSRTGSVQFDDCRIPHDCIIDGPNDRIISGGGGKTGGLQTSALALGHAWQSLNFLSAQSQRRESLRPTVASLVSQWQALYQQLIELSADSEGLRLGANQLVMTTTQAAMIAAKGAGFVAGHPVGRWCREALFFLVWSCPQNVANAQLCDLTSAISPLPNHLPIRTTQ